MALCEVQAYVYGALQAGAKIAEALGLHEQAMLPRKRAERLREDFNQAFWCEEISSFALALDGQKRPCRVRASNAGQCLISGIATRDHARLVSQTLMAPESFSGWGIRTVAESEARYNPMSYHNGSVWPHDNALIAYGFGRYGFTKEALAIFQGMFEAAMYFDLHRMPELFCGFRRILEKDPYFTRWHARLNRGPRLRYSFFFRQPSGSMSMASEVEFRSFDRLCHRS